MKRCLFSPALIFAVALVVRLLAVPIAIHEQPFLKNEPSHIAAHLVAGEGFASPYERTPIAPTAQQPPLYPFYLALVFRLLGSFSRASLIFLLLANSVMGASLTLLIYKVGRRWFHLNSAIIAAWACALLPWLVASELVISNYLFSTAFVLAWLLWLPKHEGITARKGAAFGIALGLGMLLNPMLALLWPASWRWLMRKRVAAFSLAGMALMVSPWLIRNYRSMGHVYPGLRDNLGMELYIGNHAKMNDPPVLCYSWLCQGTENYSDYPGNDPRLFSELGEQQFMRRELRQALSFIRADLAGFLIRSAKRAGSFWLLPIPWLYLPLLLLAFITLRRSRSELCGFCACLFLLYPLVFYVTQTEWLVNYRHPIEPLLLLLAAECYSSQFTDTSTSTDAGALQTTPTLPPPGMRTSPGVG